MEPEKNWSQFEYQRTISGDLSTSWQMVRSHPVQEWDVSGGGGPWNSSYWFSILTNSPGLLVELVQLHGQYLNLLWTHSLLSLVFSAILQHQEGEYLMHIDKIRNYEASWWWNVEGKAQAFESEKSKLKPQFLHLLAPHLRDFPTL